MIKSKKSFEIQFNWIFVLVAGAAIILFFSTVIVKQKNLSESSANANVLRSFESIIFGAESSLDTTNVIDFPESEIDIKCGSISVGTVSRQFQNLAIFSPNKIKGSKFITQTSQFNIPYRTSNLLAITSADVKYVIIGTDPILKEINKSMPKELRKETLNSIPPSGIKNSNIYKTRIIVSGTALNSVKGGNYIHNSREEVSILEINGNENQGKLKFYSKSKTGNPWQTSQEMEYLTFGMLMSAVYSDPELYECSKSNALKRAGAVTEVYLTRTQALVGSISPTITSDCKISVYSPALLELQAIKTNIEPDLEISAAIARLKILNTKARQMSCPLIY